MAAVEISGVRLTRILRGWTSGDESALERLTPVVYAELHRLATIRMADERGGHLLQPSALVNEAFIRLLASEPVDWESRTHFFAYAARLMRRILIDFARERNRWKRAPQEDRLRFSTMDNLAGQAMSSVDVLDLDTALTELRCLNVRQSEVVELRYFGGLEADEIADFLGIAPSTVARDWRSARAWLYGRLQPAKIQ